MRLNFVELNIVMSLAMAGTGAIGSNVKMMAKTNLPKLRAILWDVDGTLADSSLLCYESTNEVLRNNGMPEIGEDLYHQGTKLTTPRRMAWHSTGNPDHESGIELGAQFDDLYVKLVTKETAAFYDGIQDVLTGLFKKHPTLRQGALSNACGAYVRAVLDVNGVTDDFVVGLGADEVPKAKPSGEGLLQICETLKIHPSQCIYVGDAPSDGQAATNAGMPSVGVTWGSHPVETVQPAFTHTVHSTEALGLILSQMLSSPPV
jgi:phosphoglycolate phosphatase-like HAD superfamily hydrolase